MLCKDKENPKDKKGHLYLLLKIKHIYYNYFLHLYQDLHTTALFDFY